MKEPTETTLSSDIVRFLQKEKRFTLKQIGNLMNLGESFICRVGLQQREFTLKSLLILEKNLNCPLPLLILEARKEESIPSELKLSYKVLHALFLERRRLK
ncbi:MAG: hypothetical protein Q8N58_02240 [bacterium]|nr:hypothetical protein [bacterium]